jgi:AraC-like DNA-binding protein
MKKEPVRIKSLTQLHQLMGQPAPLHPLVSILDYGKAVFDPKDFEAGMVPEFYKISFKTHFRGKLKYGLGHYDFEAGGMSFIAPGQLLQMQNEEADYSGYSLHIHPDFIRPYSLYTAVKGYGFFSYSAAEALYLSEAEKATIAKIYQLIQQELEQRIDQFSQDVIISQIALLLQYSNRFYSRQFSIRKAQNLDILTKVESVLEAFFNNENNTQQGLPTVQLLADAVHLSPRYLSDLLRNTTGQNAQQLIHDKLIAKAKEYLSSPTLSVAEIAYLLGFEHPPSFTKLFKNKTRITPVQFREMISKN